MFRIITILGLLSFSVTCFFGCAGNQGVGIGAKSGGFVPEARMLENGESSHITVQHVLIAFGGTLPGKSISRSKADAETLANQVFEQAKNGEDFDQLVKKFTDDAAPGIYRMANFGEASFTNGRDVADNVYPRDSMVAAFGDTGFPLQTGEVGMSTFDPVKSPFGWHIVKRIK